MLSLRILLKNTIQALAMLVTRPTPFILWFDTRAKDISSWTGYGGIDLKQSPTLGSTIARDRDTADK
jgi:hypothetical protein